MDAVQDIQTALSKLSTQEWGQLGKFLKEFAPEAIQRQFLEEQRRLFELTLRSLEESRQEFLDRLESGRRERQQGWEQRLAEDALRAIRRELEALNEIYDQGIGAQLARVADGHIFTVRFELTEDWPSVFTANAQHLGRMEPEISRHVVTVYVLLKLLLAEYRTNNDYLNELLDIELGLRVNRQDPLLLERRKHRRDWMVFQVKRIRAVETSLRSNLKELYESLDRRGIK